jgi:hypothetical protein
MMALFSSIATSDAFARDAESVTQSALAHDRRSLVAALVPSLKLQAAIARMDGRGGPWSMTAWASLSWPLERVRQDPVERIVLQRRNTALAELAEIWRRREALRRRYEAEPTVESALDLDEADAELHALDGAVP